MLSKVALFLLCFMCGGSIESIQAQSFQKVGQVVTNFTLYMRRAWTNQTGRAFSPGAPVRLSDFAGTVVFFEFFDPT